MSPDIDKYSREAGWPQLRPSIRGKVQTSLTAGFPMKMGQTVSIIKWESAEHVDKLSPPTYTLVRAILLKEYVY